MVNLHQLAINWIDFYYFFTCMKIKVAEGIDEAQLKVWVLAPFLETNDANIDYYYDYSQSIAEYTAVFAELGVVWEWKQVGMDNFKAVIDLIAATVASEGATPILLNLCDGDEINNVPGISVIHYLLEKQLLFTGADAYFYKVTTSKIPMKECFDGYFKNDADMQSLKLLNNSNSTTVATPAWRAIHSMESIPTDIFNVLGTPIIVKPAISGGSMGVGIGNVVNNWDELQQQVSKMFNGYRGWNLTDGGIIAESYIKGCEFTVLIVGDYLRKHEAHIYPPVERVFHHSLPSHERFLSFDRLWEIYEDETAMPNDEYFYEYASPKAALHSSIMELAWDAFEAVKGKGYARIDLRSDENSGQLYVLEVNAQCGISKDEDYTSIGAILRFANTSFTQLVAEIINHNNQYLPIFSISA